MCSSKDVPARVTKAEAMLREAIRSARTFIVVGRGIDMESERQSRLKWEQQTKFGPRLKLQLLPENWAKTNFLTIDS